ncbi:MAG: AraC family transcriptional regulator N-terminal domain-containing protein [Brevundimonas sp.]
MSLLDRNRPMLEPDPDPVARLQAVLARCIEPRLPRAGDHVSAVPGLVLFRRDAPCEPALALYEPSLSLVVQGHKRAIIGNHEYDYDSRHFLLTSVNLPTMSHVIDGRPERPFLSLMLKLDLGVAQEIGADLANRSVAADASGSGMMIAAVDEGLLEPVMRLVGLIDRPEDVDFMAPLINREILYRLLVGPAGGWLRSIAMQGTRRNRIAHVITWLREHYAEPVRVDHLAAMAAMSVSTFHHHFAGVTRMSPLQFQKQIRLHEARRLLLTEPIDASTAALRVGYESATQFTREYRRQFGSPPMRDVTALRTPALENLLEVRV